MNVRLRFWGWNDSIIDGLSLPCSQVFLGALFTFPIVAAIWFTDTWYTGHIPINSNHVYDNTGKLYKVAKVVDEKTLFNEAAYKTYSPA